METSTTVKIIVGLIALLTVVRLLGKKELSQITPYDFIYVLVLGGMLEESVYDKKVPVWDMLYSIGLWAFIIFLIELSVRRYDRLKPIFKGEPTVIIEDGRMDIDAMNKNKLEAEQLRSMLRLQGIFTARDVKYAIIEPNGELSVMKKEELQPLTAEAEGVGYEPKADSLSHLVISEGRIVESGLREIGKDEEWLRAELSKIGYEDTRGIYYGEWSEAEGFFIRTSKGQGAGQIK